MGGAEPAHCRHTAWAPSHSVDEYLNDARSGRVEAVSDPWSLFLLRPMNWDEFQNSLSSPKIQNSARDVNPTETFPSPSFRTRHLRIQSSPFDDNLIYPRSNPPSHITTDPDLILQSVVSALRDLEAQIAGLRGKWWGGEVWAVRIYSGRFGVEWRRTMGRVGKE